MAPDKLCPDFNIKGTIMAKGPLQIWSLNSDGHKMMGKFATMFDN